MQVVRHVGQYRGERGFEAGALERVRPGQNLVQKHAEREDIGAAVHPGAVQLLRGHVGGCSEESADMVARQGGRGIGVDALNRRRHADRNPEIHDLDVTIVGHDHVRRLEVAMHQPALVRRFERLGDFFREPQHLRDRQRAAAQAPLERVAAHVFHDDARTPAELGHFEDLADERVIQRGGRTGFAEQPIERLALAVRRDQELDGDAPVEQQVVGETDFAHATPANRFENAVSRGRESRTVHGLEGSYL